MPRKKYVRRRRVDALNAAPEQALLLLINLFLAVSGQTKNAFGRALGDVKLVYELNGGRRLRPKTRARVRAYIAERLQKIETALLALKGKQNG